MAESTVRAGRTLDRRLHHLRRLPHRVADDQRDVETAPTTIRRRRRTCGVSASSGSGMPDILTRVVGTARLARAVTLITSGGSISY
jgi:hypothetical protein